MWNFPDFLREFLRHTDASEAGVGAFLGQSIVGDGDVSIVAYFIRRFSKSQRHYSATMNE